VRSPQTSRFDVSVGPLKNWCYLTCATLLGEGLAASLPCFLSLSTAVQQDKAPCPLVEWKKLKMLICGVDAHQSATMV
jgi:hypothetical protein